MLLKLVAEGCFSAIAASFNALFKIGNDFICNSAVNVLFIYHFKTSFICF